MSSQVNTTGGGITYKTAGAGKQMDALGHLTNSVGANVDINQNAPGTVFTSYSVASLSSATTTGVTITPLSGYKISYLIINGVNQVLPLSSALGVYYAAPFTAGGTYNVPSVVQQSTDQYGNITSQSAYENISVGFAALPSWTLATRVTTGNGYLTVNG
jgi:hypothetical protein